jgi:hypothetical protein
MRWIVLAPLLAAIPGVALAEPLTFDGAPSVPHEAPSSRRVPGVDAARSAGDSGRPATRPDTISRHRQFPGFGTACLQLHPREHDDGAHRVSKHSPILPNAAPSENARRPTLASPKPALQSRRRMSVSRPRSLGSISTMPSGARPVAGSGSKSR